MPWCSTPDIPPGGRADTAAGFRPKRTVARSAVSGETAPGAAASTP